MAGKSRRPVSDETLIADYERLRSAAQVAALYGISDQTIYYVLRKHGVLSIAPSEKRQGRVSDEQIIAAYAEHKAGRKVAELLRVAEQTVYTVLRRHGIERTGHTEFLDSIRKFDEPAKRLMIEEYGNGKSAAQVAREFDCSTETVLNVLREADIPIRYTQAQSKLAPEEHEKIKTLYLTGMSMKVIGETIGRTEMAVRRTLRRIFPEFLRPKTGPGSPHWKGGRSKDSNGYTYIWIAPEDPMASMATSNGGTLYVYEHRLNMARKLGRPLLPTETVHHINGVITDNRPENLQLRQGRHGKHSVMRCADCGSFNIEHAPLSETEPELFDGPRREKARSH